MLVSSASSAFGGGLAVLLFLLGSCGAVNERLFIAINSLLLDARYDPIVSPGTCSGHVHSVYGSADFGDCLWQTPGDDPTVETTSAVEDNHSMYWAPALYIRDPATGRHHLAPSFTRAYYRIHHDGNGGIDDIEPFPRGLRFVVGDAYRMAEWDPTDGGDGRDDIRWVLLALNRVTTNYVEHGDWRYLKEMYDAGTNVTVEQIEMKVKFPECLKIDENGVPVTDSPDHRSHGRYMEGTSCTGEYPYHIPEIDLEVRYELDKMRDLLGSDVVDSPYNWVLATGDTSGASAHADYVAGWDENLMRTIILHCRDAPGDPQAPEGVNCPGGLDDCCPISTYYGNLTREEMQEKRVDRLNAIPDEAVTDVLILPAGEGQCPEGTIPPPGGGGDNATAGPTPSPAECPVPTQAPTAETPAPTAAPTLDCAQLARRECKQTPGCTWKNKWGACVLA